MSGWSPAAPLPPSRLPRIDDGTLVRAEAVAFPTAPGFAAPHAANDVAPLLDWINPAATARTWRALVPQVGPDGNELAGLKLPDIAVPRGTHTGWNLYKAPYPAGELADRDGTFLAFAATRADREATPDARPSLAERYPTQAAYTAGVETVVAQLRDDRLLLQGGRRCLPQPCEPMRRRIGAEAHHSHPPPAKGGLGGGVVAVRRFRGTLAPTPPPNPLPQGEGEIAKNVVR